MLSRRADGGYYYTQAVTTTIATAGPAEPSRTRSMMPRWRAPGGDAGTAWQLRFQLELELERPTSLKFKLALRQRTRNSRKNFEGQSRLTRRFNSSWPSVTRRAPSGCRRPQPEAVTVPVPVAVPVVHWQVRIRLGVSGCQCQCQPERPPGRLVLPAEWARRPRDF